MRPLGLPHAVPSTCYTPLPWLMVWVMCLSLQTPSLMAQVWVTLQLLPQASMVRDLVQQSQRLCLTCVPLYPQHAAQWLLKVWGALQGQNYFHNNTRMLSIFFTLILSWVHSGIFQTLQEYNDKSSWRLRECVLTYSHILIFSVLTSNVVNIYWYNPQKQELFGVNYF